MIIERIFALGFNLVLFVLSVVLIPINAAISVNLPNFATYIDIVDQYLTIIVDATQYLLSLTLLPPIAFQIITGYVIWSTATSIAIAPLKMLFNWFFHLRK